jgi:hypothetical protein
MSYNQLLNHYGIEHLYHMTHIDNLSSILKYGLHSHSNNYKKIDISDHNVNNKRSKIEPIHNKSVHSYVPFYFNPKNHMLSRRRDIQNDIVILVMKKELINKKGAIFTDSNASTNNVNFYNHLKDLRKLNFECIYTKGYYKGYADGANRRMAEVLVPTLVNSSDIEAIICYNIYTKNRVSNISNKTALVSREFYF